MYPDPPFRSFRVALEGFSESERVTLATFFRLADTHVPGYVQVNDPAQADLLVADADHPTVVKRIVATRRVNDTVFVGAGAPSEALARVERPIEPRLILRELDQLVAMRTVRIGLDLELPLPKVEVDRDSVDLLLSDMTLPDNPGTSAMRPGHGGGRAVLVVDDSAIARKFPSARLQRLGYVVQVATNSVEALDHAARGRYSIIFLDVSLSSRLDGLEVCQAIQQRAQQRSEVAPAIVLVTGDASASERVRGSLAGCDGYLTKPLLETEFFEVLASVDPKFAHQSVGALG